VSKHGVMLLFLSLCFDHDLPTVHDEKIIKHSLKYPFGKAARYSVAVMNFVTKTATGQMDNISKIVFRPLVP
jgi:hypothetical protein